MGVKSFDFGGWATKNDLRCSDGRTIRKDAFKGDDGLTVPLVWNHKHDGPDNVLGHALLENREDGVYAYGTFNDTPNGKKAKELVRHGDLTSLSIYANQLMQNGADVLHGVIREVSLVMAGANPGAKIENVLEHSDMSADNSAIIWTGEVLCHSEENSTDENQQDTSKNDMNETEEPNSTNSEKGNENMLEHADGAMNASKDEKSIEEVFDTLNETQKNAIKAYIKQLLEKANNCSDDDIDDSVAEMSHADCKNSDKKDDSSNNSDTNKDETVEDVFNTLSEKQKIAVEAIIGQILEDARVKYDPEGGKEMKHNVFEENENTLQHAADINTAEIFADAKSYGSLKDSVLAHSVEYGIENIDYLFPDAKTITSTPEFIKREDSWVTEVLNATHHSPFSRIKSIFADITEDEARAKGYIKGKLKKDEVFTLLKRTTSPTTIYKKQRMDRDDVIDITEFDVVAWIKQEMKLMLNEEVARAILIGDGRSSASEDKISELNVRPIWTDADLYTVKAPISVSSTASEDDKAKAFIRQAVKSRKNYKGSGNPVLYTTEDLLTDMMLLEDTTGRKLYNSETELAAALRVKKIVTVPVFENQTRDNGGTTYTLAGIIVNLADYNIGADKGGAVNMFDDFDINYNQMLYLIETRCSGALTKPYSAIALEFVTAA